ncbi:hypothetical protein [Glutamicibacter arilaitensis]|uniref:hypothetical protein n=1 Tax=Glutamicibacter arilaitensis TaxID=256701 RepID=UPI00384A5783
MTEDRIAKLEEEISELRDLLTSLTLSVQYREDRAFEAAVAYNHVVGQARAALTLVLGSIQSRALGEKPQQVSHLSILEAFPVVAEAQEPKGVDLAEAIRLVAQIVGNQEQAFNVIKAHQASGFGVEAYTSLGMGVR